MGKLLQGLAVFVGAWVISQAFTATPVNAQLSATFYSKSCPMLASIVEGLVKSAIKNETRMAASLLRLHFHDCFVQGCDASILLDGPQTEKTALPNLNSVRGFEVIDTIKAAVEKVCPNVVSCADIVTLASFFSVKNRGGPAWPLLLGRRDSLTPNLTLTSQLPGPRLTIQQLKDKFTLQNMDTTDLVALSGGHTIGITRCAVISNRIFNFTNGQPDPTLNKTLLSTLQKNCPVGGDGNVTNPLDILTVNTFDNFYFKDLIANNGLLTSDQELFSADTGTKALVQLYAKNQTRFFVDFANSMLKMDSLHPLTGKAGQIRKNCRVPNASSGLFQAGGDLASDLKLLVDQMSGDAIDFFTRIVSKVAKELVDEEEEENRNESVIRTVSGSKRSSA